MAGVRSLPRRASRGKKPNFGVCNIVRDTKDVTIYDESLERMVEQAMKRSITSYNLGASVPLLYVRLNLYISCMSLARTVIVVEAVVSL